MDKHILQLFYRHMIKKVPGAGYSSFVNALHNNKCLFNALLVLNLS